jgi:hypothetical protein
MGWVAVSDLGRLMAQLAPRGAGTPSPEAQLSQAIGVDPVLAHAVDLKRPLAVGMLNPALLTRSGAARPYLAIVPVVSREAFERALATRLTVEPQPWGFAASTKSGRLFVGFFDGYAAIAWRADLLDAARRLLGPKLGIHTEAPIRVHLEMDNLYGAYGPQLERMVGDLASVAEKGGVGPPDPQAAFALRGVKQLSRYLRSVSALELLANLDASGLTVTVRVDGKADGAWAGYVQQQQPGPAWGTRFLPRDAVLVYTTHASPVGRAADIDAAIDYFAGADPAREPGSDERERWRSTLQQATALTGGELAYAVWPSHAGGLGLGGAYRVTDTGARPAVMRAYEELGSQLGALVTRALLLDPARFGRRMTMKKSSARVAEVAVDLVEIAVRWPDDAAAEKRMFETLFGPRLVLATAFVGEHGLFAVGADWSERLTTMIGAARGQPAASMRDEPEFAEALAYHPRGRVSLSYVETGRMTRMVATLMAQAVDLDAEQAQAMAEVIGDAGRGAIVSTTNASGARFELTTHVPHSAIVGAARLNGALWRIALSPLVNPPMMPPLPLPPPHVTPPVKAPTGATM